MDLRERIKKIGIKKQFIAMRIGITPSAFSHWLGGRVTLSKHEIDEIELTIHDIEVALHLIPYEN